MALLPGKKDWLRQPKGQKIKQEENQHVHGMLV